jgi:DNA-binding MarR family transcriptional regulator
MTAEQRPAATGSAVRLADQRWDHRGIDTLAQTAILLHAAQLARRHLENTVLRDAHLTFNSYDVLQLILTRQPIDTRALAQITGLAKPTISVISIDLAARHLIRRARHHSDPMVVRQYPTTMAADLVSLVQPRLAAAVTELRAGHLDGLDPTAVDLLRRLITS